MDAKQAVATAKKHFMDVFSDDLASPPTLEEVWLDHGKKMWHITLRMHRRVGGSLQGILGMDVSQDLKVVSISDKDGHAISVRNRETVAT